MLALDKRNLRRFDCVIAVSNRIQQDLIDGGVPAGRICLRHNAIVLANYRRGETSGSLSSRGSFRAL
jgi:hypothetical protein